MEPKATQEPEDLQLTDFLDLESLQQIQDSFCQATHVASLMTGTDGEPITRPSNFCHLCAGIIRQTEQGYINCRKSDSLIGQPNDGPNVHRCYSGNLMDAGVSIHVGGRHIANWLIGQIRDENFDEEKALEYADVIGADREEYRKALGKVPEMSTQQFRDIGSALYIIANQLSDIAHQKYLLKISDQKLQEANAELEQKVAERTAELKEALINLEFSQEHLIQQEKITALGNLVGGIAHEINTPLGICVTSASHLELLLENLKSNPANPDTINDILQCGKLLQSNINRAADLVSNFKRIAIDHGDPAISDFSITECIESTFKSFVYDLKVSQVSWELTTDRDYTVRGDRSQWIQVFTNLINNSLLHGFKSSIKNSDRQISISVNDYGMHMDRQFIRIIYRDNGVGIADSISKKMFEPYVSTKRSQGGSGLGLHIITTLISREMEGTIQLENEYKDGAGFIIIVPTIPSILQPPGA